MFESFFPYPTLLPPLFLCFGAVRRWGRAADLCFVPFEVDIIVDPRSVVFQVSDGVTVAVLSADVG